MEGILSPCSLTLPILLVLENPLVNMAISAIVAVHNETLTLSSPVRSSCDLSGLSWPILLINVVSSVPPFP